MVLVFEPSSVEYPALVEVFVLVKQYSPVGEPESDQHPPKNLGLS